MTDGFETRRQSAREELANLPGNYANDSAGRGVFFDAVYDKANGDAAMVPWADLKPKKELIEYLSLNPGAGKRAVDIGCGLGDNAQAIADAGYKVLGFDIVETAVNWATKRFHQTRVDYQVADLFNYPDEWKGRFDLVHECYTLQALPAGMIHETVQAICDLVATGGRLLIYTRWRENNTITEGPPWPLEEKHLNLPAVSGLTKITEKRFSTVRREKVIPLSFTVWRKT